MFDDAVNELSASLGRLAVEAARDGDLDTLVRALSAGVPVDMTSPRGDPLLMLACYYGHVAAVRALLARGADPDKRDERGQTPLAGAAFKGVVEVAEALVEGGASINAAGADGRTPLMMAAAFNRTEMVRWLLAHGADPDLRDRAGLRAIDAATALGARDAAAVLGGA